MDSDLSAEEHYPEGNRSFRQRLGSIRKRQKIIMNATRFIVTNNRLPMSSIKAETVEKKNT